MTNPKTNTPQTQQQFIDYRFSETNSKIAILGTKLDNIGNKLDDSFATKEYVNAAITIVKDDLKQTNDKVGFIYKAMWGAISIILAAVLVTILYSIGLKIQ